MSLTHWTDEAIDKGFGETVSNDRESLVRQLEFLGEMDRRRLFFGYPSLWAYVVQEYKIPESTAEKRIRAARVLQNFPELKRALECGRLTLSHLEIAQACAKRERLSDEEFREILEEISGKSCRVARKAVARMYPSDEAEQMHDRIRPLTEELSEVRFVASQELLDQIEAIRGLLAHSHPGASLSEIIGVLAKEYRERHHPEAKAARAAEAKAARDAKANDAQAERTREERSPSTSKVATPSTPNRTPTQSLVYELIRRDGYVCSYIDPTTKQRCTSKHGLEIDHIKPWTDGGPTSLDNLRYLCAGHHRRVTFLRFGDLPRSQTLALTPKAASS